MPPWGQPVAFDPPLRAPRAAPPPPIPPLRSVEGIALDENMVRTNSQRSAALFILKPRPQKGCGTLILFPMV